MTQEVRIGQVWQEVDPRFPNLPHRNVVGFTSHGMVIIECAGVKGLVKRNRFNGKRGGYRLIQDVPA